MQIFIADADAVSEKCPCFHYRNKLNKKNNVTIDTEKAFDKIQYLLKIKIKSPTQKQMGIT